MSDAIRQRMNRNARTNHEHAAPGRACAVATARAADDEGTAMSLREQQANDALRGLDEMHRSGRLDRDAYRRRRRALLEALGDTSGVTERDTVRRGLHGAGTERRRDGDGMDGMQAARAVRDDVGDGGARLMTCLCVLLGMAAGAAAVCWFMMMS
ncbi:hypothetical protein [Burkholderia plantarii]|nr:hypothetical protein [Burkholderia plantarii]